MTGDPIDAQRAYAVGLINRVVPAEQLMSTAIALAEAILANGPLAVRLSKQLIDEVPDLTMAQAWERNSEYSQIIAHSEDMREGVRAFAEKRKPAWKGR